MNNNTPLNNNKKISSVDDFILDRIKQFYQVLSEKDKVCAWLRDLSNFFQQLYDNDAELVDDQNWIYAFYDASEKKVLIIELMICMTLYNAYKNNDETVIEQDPFKKEVLCVFKNAFPEIFNDLIFNNLFKLQNHRTLLRNKKIKLNKELDAFYKDKFSMSHECLVRDSKPYIRTENAENNNIICNRRKLWLSISNSAYCRYSVWSLAFFFSISAWTAVGIGCGELANKSGHGKKIFWNLRKGGTITAGIITALALIYTLVCFIYVRRKHTGSITDAGIALIISTLGPVRAAAEVGRVCMGCNL